MSTIPLAGIALAALLGIYLSMRRSAPAEHPRREPSLGSPQADTVPVPDEGARREPE